MRFTIDLPDELDLSVTKYYEDEDARIISLFQIIRQFHVSGHYSFNPLQLIVNSKTKTCLKHYWNYWSNSFLIIVNESIPDNVLIFTDEKSLHEVDAIPKIKKILCDDSQVFVLFKNGTYTEMDKSYIVGDVDG